MVSKAARRRARKLAAARGHPMSAGAREPNGRPSRRVAYQTPDKCGPTPELLKRIAEAGPTCVIHRALALKHITQQGAQGLDTFASIRNLACFAEPQPRGVLGSMMPAECGSLSPPERDVWAKERYFEVCARLIGLPHGRHVLAAVSSVCDDREPARWDDLSAGAKVLAAMFVDGA